MVPRIKHAAAGLLCVLSTTGWGAMAPAVVATFIPACEIVRPKVNVIYTGGETPTPKPNDAEIQTYLAGTAPRTRYAEVGVVEVTSRGSVTGFNDLTNLAEREARRLGGDAIIEVTPESDRRGKDTRKFTGRIVRWDVSVR